MKARNRNGRLVQGRSFGPFSDEWADNFTRSPDFKSKPCPICGHSTHVFYCEAEIYTCECSHCGLIAVWGDDSLLMAVRHWNNGEWKKHLDWKEHDWRKDNERERKQ